HETVSSDYARRTAAIYGALDKLDRESPIGVDFARIRRAEQQALLQAQTREYLSAHPDSTQEDWEQAGLTRLYPAAELEVMALAHAVEPHVQTIMLLETSWAARFAQAENEPEKLAALKREYEQGDQQKITQAYAELSRIKAARGELARELDVDALRNRVAEACRHARERAIVTGFLDGLVEKGIVSRTEIIAELAKGKCATADRDAQGSLHALDKPYDQIISADEALAYVARQRAIGLLEQMDCQTQSLANHLAHRTGLSGRFSPDAPSIPNIPQSALDSFNHQWQRFRADLQALSEEYPGMVDVGKLEQMQLLSLRRKQVIEWLETAAKKKDSDGEFTHSWAEIAEELRKNGGFDILPPARAKEFVISLRTAPLINELGELYFQMGALMTPARGNADAAIKYEAVKAEIRRREEALRVAFQGFEEFYKPDELQPKLAEKAYAGNRAYDEYAAKVRQEHEAEAQAREDAKGWGARAWDEIVKASKSAPKILEAAVDITAGNLWGLGNAVVAAVQLKNPIEAHANAGADFILGTRSLMNNYVWGGSALGSDEQLAAMGNWSLAMSVNPLGHLGATVVEPVFGIAELTYDETARAIYNLGQGVPKTYAEFKKLQEEDVLLKAGKYGYYTFELAGSLALLLATGGGSSATQGGRLSALLYRFGLSATNSIQGGRALQALSVAGGFSAVGAAGQELQDWDNASFSRWAEHTYSGTAHSMLFLGGMSAGTQLWVRMRFGAALPQTLEEFQQLRLADPARYLRLQ
ncbi:MAG TPA: hypothetical protein PLP17_07505, partial [Oligoflexia bacterium]|nr:hypothetical protein [Oligoflexia bacterium]